MPQREGYQDALLFTISLCLVFTVCVGALRLWIRRNAYGRDDILIGSATLLSFGHFAASFASVAAGLGRKWTRIEASKDVARLNQVSSHRAPMQSRKQIAMIGLMSTEALGAF